MMNKNEKLLSRREVLRLGGQVLTGAALAPVAAALKPFVEGENSAPLQDRRLHLAQIMAPENDGGVTDTAIRQNIAEHAKRITELDPGDIYFDQSIDNFPNRTRFLNATGKAQELYADAAEVVENAHPGLPELFIPRINSMTFRATNDDEWYALGLTHRTALPDGSLDIVFAFSPLASEAQAFHEYMHAIRDDTEAAKNPEYSRHITTLHEAMSIAAEMAGLRRSDTGDTLTHLPRNDHAINMLDEQIMLNYLMPLSVVPIPEQDFSHKQAWGYLYEHLKVDFSNEFPLGVGLPYSLACDILKDIQYKIDQDPSKVDHILASIFEYYAHLVDPGFYPTNSPIEPLFGDAVEKAKNNGHIARENLIVYADFPYQIVSATGANRTEPGKDIAVTQTIHHMTSIVRSDGSVSYIRDTAVEDAVALDSDSYLHTGLQTEPVDGNGTFFDPIAIENPDPSDEWLVYRFNSTPAGTSETIYQQAISIKPKYNQQIAVSAIKPVNNT